ncbi:MAG TPA: F0F1 ATP synthase subunit B [Thermoanaerobaculia bacterium]|nr:F0F1 ATP synthase subunit B [Thermoanaerobaculia bacterium]
MRKTSLFLASSLLFLGGLVPALAQEAHGGGSVNPFAGDVGNAIWTVLIFGLLLFVLGKYAWGPILSGLQARESFIREALEKADRDRKESAAKLQEYVDKINASRAEASAIVEEGKRDGDALKRKIEEDAKAEAMAIISRGKREIEIATDTAIKDLYARSTQLATAIASGILGREIQAKDHDQLVADTIARLSAGTEVSGGSPAAH